MKKLKQFASKYLVEISMLALFIACVITIIGVKSSNTVTPTIKMDSLPLIGIDSAKVDSLTIDTLKK